MSLLLWISISEQEMDGNVLDYHRTIDCQWKDDVFCWTPCVAMIINGYCQYRILNTLALNIWMQYLTKGELNMTFQPWFSPNTCTTEIQCTKDIFSPSLWLSQALVYCFRFHWLMLSLSRCWECYYSVLIKSLKEFLNQVLHWHFFFWHVRIFKCFIVLPVIEFAN